MHPRSLIKRSSQRSVERSLRFEAIFQRLRLHVDAAPFTPRPDGFAPDDESQLYALREGLVNMCSHADYFSPMHPTVRVFDNRISFQNPGKIVVDMEHLRDRYQSAPRNPSLLKLFRYTKISDNAGYGMDKIYSWERLTGEKVEIVTDVMYSEVTFWRPKIGTSIRRKEKDSESSTAPKTAPKNDSDTAPKTAPKTAPDGELKMQDKVFRIIKSSPTINKAEIANLCGLTTRGVRYHIDKLRIERGLHWEGHSLNGRWKWD